MRAGKHSVFLESVNVSRTAHVAFEFKLLSFEFKESVSKRACLRSSNGLKLKIFEIRKVNSLSI